MSTPTDAAADATPTNVDAETKLLLHDERSCIFETRIERADLCRQRGSNEFKAGNTDKAIEWYLRALYHVEFDEGTWHFEFTDRNRADVNVVRLPVYLNLAACYLVQGDPKDGARDEKLLAKVVENADLALEIEPENAKALYRGGKALLLTGDLDGAHEKLIKAARHHPMDRNIREMLALLKTKMDAHKREEKARWGGRLVTETKTSAAKSSSKTQQKLQKPIEGSNGTLWWIAVVLIGVALALGQLSFVE